MNRFEFHASNLTQTDQLGAALAEVLPAGTTVAIRGTLGAGKTRLPRSWHLLSLHWALTEALQWYVNILKQSVYLLVSL